MPSIQSLKKQLRGIRSAQKITKAMKTIATAKFAKLNTIYNNFSEYGKQCEAIFDNYSAAFTEFSNEIDPTAPVAFIVIAANRGMCGSFNADLLSFAYDKMSELGNFLLIACNKKAANYFKIKKIPLEKEFILNDIPSYEESSSLIDYIFKLRKDGKVSKVYLIYPKYVNIMRQIPTLRELFTSDNNDRELDVLCIPDRNTIIEKTAKTVFHSMFYKIVIESAIGAQAATLITMRNAYNTASQCRFLLEGQISRKRQNAVTADVIETSAERNK